MLLVVRVVAEHGLDDDDDNDGDDALTFARFPEI